MRENSFTVNVSTVNVIEIIKFGAKIKLVLQRRFLFLLNYYFLIVNTILYRKIMVLRFLLYSIAFR